MGLLDRLGNRRQSADRGRDSGASPAGRSGPVELHRPDRVDPFLADRELRAGYRVMVDGDWRRLERFLEDSPKSWLFGSIITGDIVGMETVVFERWVEFDGSPRSRVLLASALIRDAFADQRRHRAVDPLSPIIVNAPTTVDGSAAKVADRVANRLSGAEELLHEVIAERPAMTDPWVGLLISGRGLQVDLDELRERFENAHSREPFRPDACRQYLQGLTKKWGGSNVASFDLARWLQEAAPSTSPTREALPTAHIERGLLQYGTRELATYLSQPEVVAELSRGLLDYLQVVPSPAPTLALGPLNAYALALHVGNSATARLMIETLNRIDNRPTEWPWSLFADDVGAVFAEVQAANLRAASRFG